MAEDIKYTAGKALINAAPISRTLSTLSVFLPLLVACEEEVWDTRRRVALQLVEEIASSGLLDKEAHFFIDSDRKRGYISRYLKHHMKHLGFDVSGKQLKDCGVIMAHYVLYFEDDVIRPIYKDLVALAKGTHTEGTRWHIVYEQELGRVQSALHFHSKVLLLLATLPPPQFGGYDEFQL